MNLHDYNNRIRESREIIAYHQLIFPNVFALWETSTLRKPNNNPNEQYNHISHSTITFASTLSKRIS